MTRQAIARAQLGVLTEITHGGQGLLYRAPDVGVPFAASMVYKEYTARTRAEIDVTALAAMPALVEESLAHAEAEHLVSIAAWPCELVEDGGAAIGFVMPAIPEKFFTALATAGGGSSAAEFQHLLDRSSVLAARGITIDDAQRYSLLREAASGLAFLHTHAVAAGDISAKNLLFSLTPHPAVYFINCDAMRINGISVLPQVETPGWQVPAGEELATIYSDIYKLGLLALRLLAGDRDTTNSQHLPASTPDLLRQVITDSLNHPPQQRPQPEAWIYVLGSAIEQAQYLQKTIPPTPLGTPAAPIQEIVYSQPLTSPAQFTPPSWPPAPAAWEQPPVHEGVPTFPPPGPPPWTPPPAARKSSTTIALLVGAIVILAVALAVAIVIPALNKQQPTTAPVAQPAVTIAPTTSTTTPPPVAENALDGLLLDPAEIAAVQGVTTPLTETLPMNDFIDGTASDLACESVSTFRDTRVFADSGWIGMRGNQIQDSKGSHAAAQMVILFPTARDAQRFFTESAQSWQACVHHQVTITMPGGTPTTDTVGTVLKTNNVLTAKSGLDGESDQHALTVANNVVIDTLGSEGTAAEIARRIAAKVPTE